MTEKPADKIDVVRGEGGAFKRKNDTPRLLFALLFLLLLLFLRRIIFALMLFLTKKSFDSCRNYS